MTISKRTMIRRFSVSALQFPRQLIGGGLKRIIRKNARKVTQQVRGRWADRRRHARFGQSAAFRLR